ncbi:MAG: metallophosphoesterase family protein [Clostridia bacterium]|nr:metallophosphoesterase family protein [Clostridia bacterium]
MKKYRIGIFSDTHGNLPALIAVSKLIKQYNCDEVFHLGDIINTGGYPKECLEFFHQNDWIQCIMGNHDKSYVKGTTKQNMRSFIKEEHTAWQYDKAGTDYVEWVSRFPLEIYREWNGLSVALTHYAKSKVYPEKTWEPIEDKPTAEIFDDMFSSIKGDVVIFGHKHSFLEILSKSNDDIALVGEGIYNKLQGRRYIETGSVGSHAYPFVCAIIFEVYTDGSYDYKRITAPYNPKPMFEEMKALKIPFAEDIINHYFYGNTDF